MSDRRLQPCAESCFLSHSSSFPECKDVYKRQYNKLGQQASAGCIRLAVTDAKWIYDHCRLGTKVVIGEGLSLIHIYAAQGATSPSTG